MAGEAHGGIRGRSFAWPTRSNRPSAGSPSVWGRSQGRQDANLHPVFQDQPGLVQPRRLRGMCASVCASSLPTRPLIRSPQSCVSQADERPLHQEGARAPGRPRRQGSPDRAYPRPGTRSLVRRAIQRALQVPSTSIDLCSIGRVVEESSQLLHHEISGADNRSRPEPRSREDRGRNGSLRHRAFAGGWRRGRDS